MQITAYTYSRRKRLSMVEKRQSERQSIRHRIHQFVKVDFNREEFLAAEALNLSMKGMLCQIPRPLSPGQRLFLMLNLGKPETPDMVNLDAIVVWTKQEDGSWNCGLEFIDLPEDDSRMVKIIDFLNRNPA